MLINIEPFHFGAEVILEMPPGSSMRKLSSINQDRVYMVLLDDKIVDERIRSAHLEAAQAIVAQYGFQPVIFLHETDLISIAFRLLSLLPADKLDWSSRRLYLKTTFLPQAIRLANTQIRDPFAVTPSRTDYSTAELKVLFDPSCQFFIGAWHYLRLFADAEDLSRLATDVRESQVLAIESVAARIQPNSSFERRALLKTVLNSAYETPEQLSRFIAMHYESAYLAESLSYYRYTSTQYYTLYDALRDPCQGVNIDKVLSRHAKP
jgi:hypothetical protein